MKKLFSSVIALAFAFCANAQGDSQKVVYAENFNSLTAVTQDVCGYSKDMATNSTTLYGAQPVEGWTVAEGVGVADSGTEGNGVVGAIFAYGSEQLMRGGTVGAPATNAAGETGNAFGILAIWTNTIKYTKDVELEAGKYTFTVPTYCAKGNGAITNYTGVTVADKQYFSTTTSFAVEAWTTQTIEFSLSEKSTVTLSLGYKAANSGSGVNPHLFIDNLTIVKNDLDAYKQKVIAKTESLPVGNGLFLYTQESIDAFKTAVNAATTEDEVDAVAMPSAAQPKADAEYIIKNLSGEVYLSVNAEKNVFLGAEETKFTFETAEGGFYLKSGEFYVGLAGSNTWSMSSAADKKAVITVNPVLKDGAYVYSLGNKNGLIGSDNAGAGSGCYANKKIENNGLWTITEFVVVPTEVTFVVDNADKVRVINEDFSQLDLENEEDNMLDPGQYVISSADADYTLYSVSMNGEALVAVNGKFTIDAKAGDKVEIKADYPEKNSNIEFTGAEAIKSIAHSGNKTITEAPTAAVSVKNGYKMTVTLDTEKFNVKSVTVNGDAVEVKDGAFTCLVTANATVAIDAKAIVAPVIAAGDYFIINVATGRYFNGANSWGTKASVTKTAQAMTLAVLEDGTYNIDSHISNGGNNHFLAAGVDVYVDGAASPQTIEKVADGIFTIKDVNGKYLAVEAGMVANFKGEDATDAAAQWMFVTKDELYAGLAEATKDSPVDAGFLIADANLSRNNLDYSAWKGDAPAKNARANGSLANNMNLEKWGANSQTFDTYQEIELPNGIYSLSVQGFYRYNNTTDNINDVAKAAHADGTEVIFSKLYANNDTVALKSLFDDEITSAAEYDSSIKIPFSQNEAADAFNLGFYNNELTVEVTDGKLKFGIVKTDHIGTDWTVWDNFELFYYGEKEKVAEIETADLTKEMFFQYNSNTTGEALETPATIGSDYNVGTSTGMVYGLSTVKWFAYADITDYDHLVLNVTEGTPRVMYNREMTAGDADADGVNHVEITAESPYLTVEQNADGSKSFIYNLKAMAAADANKPFVHINAIKGANWANTNVTSMKLFKGDIVAGHSHEYAEAWTQTESHHYHLCATEGCNSIYSASPAVSNYGAHTYGESMEDASYYTCSACQYEDATRKETATAISTVSVDAAKSGKFVENGKIVIVKNGVKYNVAGQTIK